MCYDRRAQYGRTQPRYIKATGYSGARGEGNIALSTRHKHLTFPKLHSAIPRTRKVCKSHWRRKQAGAGEAPEGVPVCCSVWCLSCTVGSSVAHKGLRASTWVIVPTPSTLDVGIRCEHKRSGDVRRSIPSFCCYPSAALLLLPSGVSPAHTWRINSAELSLVGRLS